MGIVTKGLAPVGSAAAQPINRRGTAFTDKTGTSLPGTSVPASNGVNKPVSIKKPGFEQAFEQYSHASVERFNNNQTKKAISEYESVEQQEDREHLAQMMSFRGKA